MSVRRPYGLLGLAIALGVLAVIFAVSLAGKKGAGLQVGGVFSLVASDGRQVAPSTWPGKVLVLTFGYRFCPDVCPTNLQRMAEALGLLGTLSAQVQPLFITIDPERDTPAVLAEYVALFHPRLIGLTGTKEQIAAVTKTFRVYYARVPGRTVDTYTMDHSAYIFLANDQGQVLKIFPHDAAPDQIAAAIRSRLQPQG